MGAPYLTSRKEILEAMQCDEPDRADEWIERRIDMLIGDVRNCWSRYAQQQLRFPACRKLAPFAPD